MTFTSNSIFCMLIAVCFALGFITYHLSYLVVSMLLLVTGLTILLTYIHSIVEDLIKLKYELEMSKNNAKVKHAIEQHQSISKTLH